MSIINETKELSRIIGEGNISLVIIIVFIILFMKNKEIREMISSFKDQGLNKYKRYGDNYISLAREENTIELNFIERKTKDILLTKLTGIRDYNSRRIYMFLLSKPYRCDIPEGQLKEIVKYITHEDKKFSTDFKRYKKDRKINLFISMISLLLMLTSIFLSVFKSYSNPEEIHIIPYVLVAITEFSWLWFYNKLPKRKKMQEYADKLAQIDTSEFK
ncbi:hypothetical protein [Xenorhabdus sp. KK7.4]|uniref:hypothetical protein n=1 Tax=Xenorhabdus sp. KK7.4 TaxID=1851572 RepID=UPI000C0556CC|nr:hypothetical protein [Xenorhabdus sp. KK7.4]PHM49553.1 hypothetical protein Xekk_04314 [Xenorhabdus sp. KK7.4]